MGPTFSSLNLVLLGPPGSGKGTQARLLAERYQLPHIYTGDMLWGEVANGTGLGGEVHPDLHRGELVRDRLRVYHQHAEELAEYYRNRDQLVVVDGNQTISRVANEMERSVGAQVVA